MPHDLWCGNGAYRRDEVGWSYAWGEPVPGSIDLTLADLWRIGDDLDPEDAVALRTLSPEERRWLSGDADAREHLRLHERPGQTPNAGDLIVGVLAPELHPALMLTLVDVAELLQVSKSTVDSYRYRGLLPAPQALAARTPLWARPIIDHWTRCRPGSGARSDGYRGSASPTRVIDVEDRATNLR